jgi:hypothetical protein
MGVAGVLVAADEEVARRRRRRAAALVDPEPEPEPDVAHRPTLVALVTWLAVVVGVLSVAQVPHTAYLAAVGVPVAVLAGAGLAGVLDRVRTGTTRARRGAFIAVLVQLAWSGLVLTGYGHVPGVLVAALLAAGAVGALAAAATAFGPGAVPARAAAALVLVATLLPPVVWTALVLDPHDNGSSSDAYAGPRQQVDPGAIGAWSRFSVPLPWQGRDPRADAPSAALAASLRRADPVPAGAVVLTDYWGETASLVLGAGVDARAAGGFSGRVAVVTPEQLTTLVRAGGLPFALLHDQASYVVGRSHRHLTPAVIAVDQVVRRLCRAVPSTAWDRGHPLTGMTLYDCRR